MKTILVPTDFSANSENAIHYAAELCLKMTGRIILFHSYTIPVYATDVPMAIPSEDELRDDAMQSLNALMAKMALQHPSIDMEIKAAQGFSAETIAKQEKKLKTDYVVMGTRGASGLREILLGSNTADVMGKSICPVIAVPKDAKWHGLKKIVFAANYSSGDFENVFSLIEFARLFDSEVILLHIDDGSLAKTFEFNELHGFTQQIRNESKYPKISFKLFEDKDTYEGLNLYLEEVKADMLAVSMRHRSFARKFFSRSLTKKMVYHTHIPMTAFHTEE